MKRSSTNTLIHAMFILARDIQSDDGVANAVIKEAAERLDEMVTLIDGCFEVFELSEATTPSQKAWKEKLLKRALAVGANREW